MRWGEEKERKEKRGGKAYLNEEARNNRANEIASRVDSKGNTGRTALLCTREHIHNHRKGDHPENQEEEEEGKKREKKRPRMREEQKREREERRERRTEERGVSKERKAVISQSTIILELLAFKDQPLLFCRNA